MIDIIIEEILNYIKDDICNERILFLHLIEWLKKIYQKENEYANEELRQLNFETYSGFIKELKDVRRVYQEGNSFVRNQTKNKKKGYNFRWYQILEKEIERGEMEEAREFARTHLEFVKRIYSERTYYRHLKKVRELKLS